jgi:hypothetical protein
MISSIPLTLSSSANVALRWRRAGIAQLYPKPSGDAGNSRVGSNRCISGCGWPLYPHFGLANGALLAELRSAAHLAGFFIVFPLAQFFLQAASFQQFLEAAERGADRLPVMNTHSQRHIRNTLLWKSPPGLAPGGTCSFGPD